MGQVIWYPSWMIGPKDRLKSMVPKVLKFPICDPKKGWAECQDLRSADVQWAAEVDGNSVASEKMGWGLNPLEVGGFAKSHMEPSKARCARFTLGTPQKLSRNGGLWHPEYHIRSFSFPGESPAVCQCLPPCQQSWRQDSLPNAAQLQRSKRTSSKSQASHKEVSWRSLVSWLRDVKEKRLWETKWENPIWKTPFLWSKCVSLNGPNLCLISGMGLFALDNLDIVEGSQFLLNDVSAMLVIGYTLDIDCVQLSSLWTARSSANCPSSFHPGMQAVEWRWEVGKSLWMRLVSLEIFFEPPGWWFDFGFYFIQLILGINIMNWEFLLTNH